MAAIGPWRQSCCISSTLSQEYSFNGTVLPHPISLPLRKKGEEYDSDAEARVNAIYIPQLHYTKSGGPNNIGGICSHIRNITQLLLLLWS